MKSNLLSKRGMLCAFLVGTMAMVGAFDKSIIKSVREMERSLGLTIVPPYGDLLLSSRPVPRGSETYVGGPPGLSPDGTAIGWWWEPYPYHGEKIPFVTVKTIKGGEQSVWVEGRVVAGSFALSSEAKMIVAIARPLDPAHSRERQLLAIDRRNGVDVRDLTSSVTEFQVGNDVEDISVSVQGTLAALGTRNRIQVLEIASGRTVYVAKGRFPRLSPAGDRLAFVGGNKLLIWSFSEGSTRQLLVRKRVKGVGGWSPDGRFLIAGAWMNIGASEKNRIIVDTTTGEYAVMGTLGEGDYAVSSHGSQRAFLRDSLLNSPAHFRSA